MAKWASKGTVVQQTIDSVFVAVAQVFSVDHSGAATETFECDSLDNVLSGIPKQPTGRAAGGTYSLELFLDPALAGHQYITDELITPALNDWKVIWSDTASTEWDFSVAGVGVGATAALADGLKMTVELEVNGLTEYPSDATTTTSA
jgi:hypothetical protein